MTKVKARIRKGAPMTLPAFVDATKAITRIQTETPYKPWYPTPTLYCIKFKNRKRRIYKVMSVEDLTRFFIKLDYRRIYVEFIEE